MMLLLIFRDSIFHNYLPPNPAKNASFIYRRGTQRYAQRSAEEL